MITGGRLPVISKTPRQRPTPAPWTLRCGRPFGRHRALEWPSILSPSRQRPGPTAHQFPSCGNILRPERIHAAAPWAPAFAGLVRERATVEFLHRLESGSQERQELRLSPLDLAFAEPSMAPW